MHDLSEGITDSKPEEDLGFKLSQLDSRAGPSATRSPVTPAAETQARIQPPSHPPKVPTLGPAPVTPDMGEKTLPGLAGACGSRPTAGSLAPFHAS